MVQTAEQKAIYQAYINKEISRETYLERIQATYTRKAKSYYAVSSKVLDITDATKTTAKFYETMQAAAPKTVEESAQLEYNFAKQAIADYQKAQNVASSAALAQVVTPQNGGQQQMSLAFLGSLASSALAAAKSPTGQALLGGVGQALGVAGTTALGLGEGKLYSVKRRNGRIVDQTTGRTIGYTPQAAKKKYKVRRRRKRWTQADERKMQWQAYIASIAAGQAGIPPPPL